MKFAASVSWRALTCYSHLGLKHFSAGQLLVVAQALASWRSFLLDKTEHPGPHQLHMMLLDRIEDHTFENLPKNFNRYLVRSIEPDIVRSQESVFVYVKMCRVLVIGFAQTSPKERWVGTKLRVRKGEIGGKNYKVPSQLLKYLCGRAQRLADQEAAISPRQRQKIDSEYEKQMERALNSESLSIGLHDFEMFGPP